VCRRKQHRYQPIDTRRLSFKTKKDTQEAIKAIIASTQPPTDQVTKFPISTYSVKLTGWSMIFEFS
jgi:hypothetical protein